ncbi:sugar ABC transporter substrate-binding protein [uncultured Jatrophihabitans sp.]|uniref:sugar ABC transporter substrate-binding protein n=1 Tax=uncultured Jatrophihabitans sp. TaxID=1610747 RepID=UPI0035CC6510
MSALLKPPTGGTIQTPLKATPPKDKTIVYMECTDGPSCLQIGQGVEGAATALGWTVKTLTFQEANPATLASGLRTALQYHPVATVFVGTSYPAWSSVVPAYTRANAALVPIGVGPAPTSNTILPQVYGGAARKQIGGDLANWAVAASKGKAHVLFLNVPAFAVLSPFLDGFTSTVRSRCRACSVSVVDATIPQFNGNQINSLIVAAVQKDPKINYIISPDAFINGLPQALRGAGIDGRVKIGGNAYGPEQIADIKNGTETAWIGASNRYYGWLAVDGVLRHLAQMTVQSDAPVPTQLITKQNVDSIKSQEYYEPPFDYEAQFKRLWNV